MILTDFDQDAYEEMIKEDAKMEGMNQTLQAARLLHSGMSIKEAAAETGLSKEAVETLQKLMRQA